MVIRVNTFFRIENVPVCNADVFMDLVQCGVAKYLIFVLLSLKILYNICFIIIQDFESSIAELSVKQGSKFFKEEMILMFYGQFCTRGRLNGLSDLQGNEAKSKMKHPSDKPRPRFELR